MGGRIFPTAYMDSDVRCLRAAQLDFPLMVRRCLNTLSPHRSNTERVARLRPDNPERVLMEDLVVGMMAHLPKDFTPNGLMQRSPRRPIYETVANAHWTHKKGKKCGRPLVDLHCGPYQDQR
jgi:hypothetical protein